MMVILALRAFGAIKPSLLRWRQASTAGAGPYMKRGRALWGSFSLLFMILVAAAWSARAAQATVFLDVPSSRGVSQEAVVEEVDAPLGIVLLFAGGDGGMRFGPKGEPLRLRGNFLIRTREMFQRHGFTTVMVGTPSDHSAPPFMNDQFRASPAHAQDIGALIAELRRRYDKQPIWLVGTSRGTVSVAAIPLHLGPPEKGGPDGIVLTSSLTDIADTGIDKMPVPTLVVAHMRDDCRATRGSDVHYISKKLKAPSQQIMSFKGGSTDGPLCGAFAYHGYNGIEERVVAAIAGWIVSPVQ